MARVSITFDKIKTKRTKVWKDPATGKRRQQTQEFWGTSNPFNGYKDPSLIDKEINKKANDWMMLPPPGLTQGQWNDILRKNYPEYIKK